MDRYLTSSEVAELCRTSPSTVRWWRHVGRGPRATVLPGGRRVLYAQRDVEAFLAAGREPERETTPAAASR
ncbi:helix-turn-helix transcriptional regulator [Serinicoccus kebangsaanensis]|uniref:helix-turn-helix transcriptional regulator n=1 Tax=Serinicoccus kebangsaanensis TaxID=2602069 RepID=UPI00124BD2B7|nr:helix-turn-helix domain-containing protein [Serinicoccus kebangsaanensis]